MCKFVRIKNVKEQPLFIYEDADIIAVDKPAGVVVHEDDHHIEGSLLSRVKTICDSAQLLHRLDKDTSGVLLFSKNSESYVYYKKLFHDHKVEKQYTALVVGTVKNKEGTIDLPIARSTSDPRKRSTMGGKGLLRAAVTTYKVKTFFPGYTLLDVFPKTGRTHQIRTHLSSIGHPIACDRLYGGKRYSCPTGLHRQFLHAATLVFTTREGKRLRLESDLPKDLAETLLHLQTQK